MDAQVDYKIDVLIFGAAGYPADWVYDGKYKAGEFTSMTFGVTAVRGGGKNILIDSGCDMDSPVLQSIFFDVYHANETMGHLEDALALIDLRPEDIDEIIITHVHLDHLGGLSLFPNARFYVQEKELEGWERIAADPMMAPVLMPTVCLESDLKKAREFQEEGRVTLIDGDVKNLLPGIDVYALGGCHSVNDQIVVVNTPDGSFVDVGDIASRDVQITGIEGVADYYMWPSGSAGSKYRTMSSYQQILDLAGGDIKRVIMRHDSTYAESKVAAAIDGNHVRYQIR